MTKLHCAMETYNRKQREVYRSASDGRSQTAVRDRTKRNYRRPAASLSKRETYRGKNDMARSGRIYERREPRSEQSRADTASSVSAVLEQRTKRAELYRALGRLGTRLAATAATVLIIFGVIAGFSIISGASMEPSMLDGDLVLFWRLGSWGRGDIVIIQLDSGEHIVKRIIGLPGDTVSIDDASGRVIVNGVGKDEKYVYSVTHLRENDISFPATVPENTVFVLGDNRAVSQDSRELGMIPVSWIRGTVFFSFRLIQAG